MNEMQAYQPQQGQLGYPMAPTPTRVGVEPAGDGPLQLMWRRKWIVALALMLCVGAAVAYLRVATPLYTSSAKLTVTGDVINVLGAGGTKADPAIDFMAQQATLMGSKPVVTRALKEFDVAQMQTFQGVRDPASYVQKNLLIEPGRKDGLFTLYFDAPNAEEGAAILNAILDAYIHDRVESDPTANILNTLYDEQAVQEKELARQEKELADFKLREGSLFFETKDRSNVVLETLTKLNDALSAAKIAEIQARVEYAGANNKALAFQKLQAAEASYRQLLIAFEAQQEKAAKLNQKAAEHEKLLNLVKRTDLVLQNVVMRIHDLRVQKDVGAWTVRKLEEADVERNPSKPAKPKIMALAIVMGLMLGFGGAWVREKTDHRLSNAEEISQILGLPVLALVPSMPGRAGAVVRGQKVHLESMSDVAEAFRTLRTVVYFSVPDNKAKTILLTSPFQGEGKSTTASGLAIAMAKAGRRTLVIDGDLRKPTLHRIFELSDQVGLSSVMAGRETLDKAIQKSAVDGLDVLPCGPIPANPSEILNSKAFAEMLQVLSARYDHILIDSPPVLPVTDARILGAICDVTLLVLRANRSTRRMSEYAAEAMLGVGARVLGVVVNDVPRSKRSGYYGGYGYGNYGYGRRSYEVTAAQQPVNGNGKGAGAQKRLPKPAAETPAA